jgi:tRNA A58 N-methylase Trm61
LNLARVDVTLLQPSRQTRGVVQPLLICPGKDFNSKFGAYRHSDLVGIPYGSKVGSRNGKGFIHVLRPTPELWTMALPHRTQILYLADIAFITSWLNITRGSRVIEAGAFFLSSFFLCLVSHCFFLHRQNSIENAHYADYSIISSSTRGRSA